MPLPQFHINPYVRPYAGGVSQDYANVLEHKIKDYDTTTENEDILGYQSDILHNMVLPQDVSYTNELVDKVRSSIKERTDKGDYENLGRVVKRSARDFAVVTQPLLARKEQYSQYLKDMNESLAKGDIGRDTFEKSIARTQSGIKGFNPYDSTTHNFGVFKPTKDLSIVDKLNKFFGDTFKGDKSTYGIINPITGLKETVSKETNESYVKSGDNFLYYDDTTGSYNTEAKGRKISQIELAGRQYLQGDKETQNYFDTQKAIGNDNRVASEVHGALSSEMQKLGYNITLQDQDTLDSGWWKYYNQKDEMNKPFESAAEVPSQNIHVNPKFQEYSFSPNGNFGKNTEYFNYDKNTGNYYKFFDKNGKQLTLNEKGNIEMSNALSKSKSNELTGIKTVKVSREEQEKVDKEANKEFNTLVDQTLLADKGYSNVVDLDAQRKILDLYSKERTSPKYREQVRDRYNESIKNFKTVENQLWTQRNFAEVKEIGDINVPKGVDGNSVLAKNLLGRTIHVLSNDSDLKVNTEGINDINTLLTKVQEKGWNFVNMTGNGLLMINPSSKNPGSSATLEFKDKDGKVKYINAAIDIGDADNKKLLKMMQNVGMAYLSGNGGKVNIPGTKAGYKVVNIPNQVVGIGLPSFTGLVQAYDDKGNNVGEPKPIMNWLNDFINTPAVREQAQSFLVNK